MFGAIMLVLAIPFMMGCVLFNLWNWNQSGSWAIGEVVDIVEHLIKKR